MTESPVDAAAVHAEEPRRLHDVAGGLLQRALDERLFGRFEVQGQARRTARRGRRPPDATQRASDQAEVDGSIGAPALSMSARSIMFFSSRTLPGNAWLSSSASARGVSGGFGTPISVANSVRK